MLEEMEVDTGVDLGKLIAVSSEVQKVLGRTLGAHLLTAGPVDWHRG
jgi:hydroxymethylglutaryl-CoA lyase